MASTLNVDDETLTALLYEAWRAVQAVVMPVSEGVGVAAEAGPALCIACGGMVPSAKEAAGHGENCPFGGLMRLVAQVVVRDGGVKE